MEELRHCESSVNPNDMATTFTLIRSTLFFAACVFLLQCRSKKLADNTQDHVSANIQAANGGEIGKVVALAKAFETSLTSGQKEMLQLGWSKADAAKWSNFPQAFSHPQRVGISFSQMDANQIGLAKALLAYVLQDKIPDEGFDETEGILAADNLISSLPGKANTFGAGNYYIAFLGKPSTTQLWELQFGGHHLAFSNTYNNGELIGMTPSFRGVEPMSPVDANGRHYLPMEQERSAFSSILESLSDSERNAARLNSTFTDILLGPGKDNAFPEKKLGLRIGALSNDRKRLVLAAIGLYVKDQSSGKAEAVLAAYAREIDETYLSFSGSTTMSQINDYIRIDGPGVWIEYNAQPSRDLKITPTHAHSVWRDHIWDYGGQ